MMWTVVHLRYGLDIIVHIGLVIFTIFDSARLIFILLIFAKIIFQMSARILNLQFNFTIGQGMVNYCNRV